MSAGICCNNTSDVPVQVLVRQKYWPHSADRDLPAAGDTMQRRVCVYCSAEFVCPASFRGKNPKCSGCRATHPQRQHAPAHGRSGEDPLPEGTSPGNLARETGARALDWTERWGEREQVELVRGFLVAMKGGARLRARQPPSCA
jgi:hypothetical protein